MPFTGYIPILNIPFMKHNIFVTLGLKSIHFSLGLLDFLIRPSVSWLFIFLCIFAKISDNHFLHRVAQNASSFLIFGPKYYLVLLWSLKNCLPRFIYIYIFIYLKISSNLLSVIIGRHLRFEARQYLQAIFRNLQSCLILSVISPQFTCEKHLQLQ